MSRPRKYPEELLERGVRLALESGRPTRSQIELAIVEYLGWFNNSRLHESLGDIPPAELEQRHPNRRALAISFRSQDKILQRAVVEVLGAIYETDFLGFSYGFRPGRSPHDALDALAAGIHKKKVNWVLDADIRDFFTSLDRCWLERFLEHRIADRRVLRLIRKWLKARSTSLATASLHASMGLLERSDAPALSRRRRLRSVSRYGQGFTPVSASLSTEGRWGLLSTSEPELRLKLTPARCWSLTRSRTSSPARESSSRTEVSPSSRAYQASGACLPSSASRSVR
jgi:hypothetical protein